METEDGEKPRVISNRYTASLHEKSVLCQHLESWRGKRFTDKEKAGFYLGDLTGKNCLINVIHNSKGDKVYANIASIMPLMAGMEKAEPESPIMFYDMEKDGLVIPEGIYEWVEKIIKQSRQFNPDAEQQYAAAAPTSAASGNDMGNVESYEDDSIPF